MRAACSEQGHLLVFGGDGRLLYKQLIHRARAVRIKCHESASNLSRSSELYMLFADGCAARFSSADVRDVVQAATQYGTDDDDDERRVPHLKWRLRQQESTSDIVGLGLLGVDSMSLSASLAAASGEERQDEHVMTFRLLSAGRSPALALYHAPSEDPDKLTAALKVQAPPPWPCAFARARARTPGRRTPHPRAYPAIACAYPDA